MTPTLKQRLTLMATSLPDKNVPQTAVFKILGKLFSFVVGSGPELNSCRTLKRTKAYANLEDVRPTIRNKPSGLKSDWHRTVSNASMPRQQVPVKNARSSSLSASTSSSLSQSLLLESDHSLCPPLPPSQTHLCLCSVGTLSHSSTRRPWSIRDVH